MIIGHGGNMAQAAARAGLDAADITDMSSNTNPLGPMPGMLEHLKNSMDAVTNLPEADSRAVVQAFAGMNGLDSASILAAGGTTQFIYSLPRLFPAGKALILGPTYSDYADACAMNRVPVTWAFPEDGRDFAHDFDMIVKIAGDHDFVFLCNPNNPTGNLYAPDTIQWFAKKCPNTVFVMDESYLPFVAESSALTMAGTSLPNVLVLSSFSKIFKAPGLRIGFAIAPKGLKEKLETFQLPWSVGSLAQEAVLFAANNQDAALAYIEKTAAFVAQERKTMEDTVRGKTGITPYPGVTPFVLFHLPPGLKSQTVWEAMLQQGILVRDCANFQGLGLQFVRVSLKNSQANARAAEMLVTLATDAGMKGGD
ncbi:MAG: pyridoxal phosphate-dependent class II aminotransferase [Desulfatibacillum sp.]|nr:pyridoxal phosphate-dependent class II aminotransferase [Desulfatibacillum sp.]